MKTLDSALDDAEDHRGCAESAGGRAIRISGPRRSWWYALPAVAMLVIATPVVWLPWRLPLLTLAMLPLLPLAWIMLWQWRGGSVDRTGLEIPLLGLLVTSCIAALPVVDWDTGLPKLLGMALAACTAASVALLLRSRAALLCAMAVFSLAIYGLGAVGLLSTAWNQGKQPLFATIYDRLPGSLRGSIPGAASGEVHPNELAGVLVLMIPPVVTYGIAMLRSDTGAPATIRRGLALASFGGAGFGLAVLILTGSRSGIAGIGLVLAILVGTLASRVTRSPRHPLAIKVLVAAGYAVSLAVGTAGAAVLFLRWIASDATGFGLDTFASRLELWRLSIALLRDFPFTGVGLGQFNIAIHGLYIPLLVSPYEDVPHAHNLILEYAVEMGIPAAIAFVCLLVAYFRGCLRVIGSMDPLVRWVGPGLALGVVAFLVFGTVDAIAPGARAGIVLWVVFGLGAGTGSIPTAATPQGGVSS